MMNDEAATHLAAQWGTPLLVLDCDKVQQHYEALTAALPNVELFYALKALSHVNVINTLAACGAGFDVASCGEIECLRQARLTSLNMIHTHPIKSETEIAQALRFGCTTFVVDNPYELEKFLKHRHRVGLLLRLSFHDSEALVNLSDKFGCTPDEASWLLRRAKHLKLNIKGLSFHVGSQSKNASAYAQAIHFCRDLINHAEHENIMLSCLDIGGGFPIVYDAGQTVSERARINAFCAPIRSALNQLPDWVRVIAEPGRYLVASAVTSITKVIGKARKVGVHWYYLDDGLYGSFNGQVYDHVTYPIRSLRGGPLQPSVLAGPTCDGFDVIRPSIDLPDLQLGDLLVAQNMGAYTAVSRTHFNRLIPAKMIAISEGFQDATRRLSRRG